MPLRPDALDYDDLFPTKRKTAREEESFGRTPFVPGRKHEDVADDSQPVNSTATEVVGPTDSSGTDRPLPNSQLLAETKDPLWRHSHTLSFTALFIFSIVLYVRPYELIPALSSFTSMAFYTGLVLLGVYLITQLSTEGNLTARPREINLVLLIGVAALLSMPLADSPGEAWTKFSDMLLKTMLIFIVLVNVVRTEMRLRLLLLLVLAVSIYLSVNAIDDYRAGLFQLGEAGTIDARIAGRIKGLFENSNDLALHLVTMIPIAIALGLAGRGPIRKLLYLGGAAIMVAAVVVTFSRGGFLGLVAAAFVLARRLARKSKATTTAAMVFALLLFMIFAPGGYGGRISTIFNSAADLTESSTQRTEVLKRSIWVALRYPLFGVGIGNFRYKSPRNLETHNAYTQVAAEMGIAAMVVYIMFLVHPIRRLRLIENESYSKPERRRFYYLSIGLQGSMVGYMVSSFFGAVAYQWYVYYLVGYAVCLHRLFIMKFPPEDYKPGYWEHPFAEKK
ncbi:MAG TPA: O-antigen ligase family protein [Pyrinomonadaceae bacterium]